MYKRRLGRLGHCDNLHEYVTRAQRSQRNILNRSFDHAFVQFAWSAQLPSFLVLFQQFRTPVGISAHPSFSARFGSDPMLTGLATIVYASGLLGGLRGDLISLKVAIHDTHLISL